MKNDSRSATTLRARIYRHLHTDSRINRTLAALIAINLAAVVLQTVQSFDAAYGGLFLAIEYVSIAVFSAEYLARVWSCVEAERYRHPVLGRARYVLSPMALIDLAAIIPFYMPMLIPVDLRMLRSLRLLRMIRILKMGRYSKSVQLVYRAVAQTREQLGVVLVVIAILMLLACSAMYFFENEAQPEHFSSIPATFWWGVMTLTTVGYGDVYPVTPAGKTTAAVVAFLGIGLFALPAGIVTSAFVQMLGKDDSPKTCPHCGKVLD
jgi:voltage-gated potassium channel